MGVFTALFQQEKLLEEQRRAREQLECLNEPAASRGKSHRAQVRAPKDGEEVGR